MNKGISILNRQIKTRLLLFMVALVISGATAIPVEAELKDLLPHLPVGGAITVLLQTVLNAVRDIKVHYPFLLYGYDWLAFAHFVIAIAFIGPYRQPVKNIWVIEFGLIACIMVFPFAFIMGAWRGLPVWWQLIDCSFGVFGFALLWVIRKKIMALENLLNEEKLNLVF